MNFKIKTFLSITSLALFVLSILTVVIMVTPVARASTPSLTLNPTSGSAGATVNFATSGFNYDDIGEIDFNGKIVASVSMGSGTFTGSFVVPSVSPNTYPVKAVGLTYGEVATTSFEVSSGASAPNTWSKPFQDPIIDLLLTLGLIAMGFSLFVEAKIKKQHPKGLQLPPSPQALLKEAADYGYKKFRKDCAGSVKAAAEKLGVHLPSELNANGLADYLGNIANGFREVSKEKAQDLANKGILVIAAKAEFVIPHGHVMIVVPGNLKYSPKSNDSFPMVEGGALNKAGSSSGNKSARDCWNTNAIRFVQYYTPL